MNLIVLGVLFGLLATVIGAVNLNNFIYSNDYSTRYIVIHAVCGFALVISVVSIVVGFAKELM